MRTGRNKRLAAYMMKLLGRRGTVLAVAVLAALALHTLVWIEILNHQYGDYLPRKGEGTWRYRIENGLGQIAEKQYRIDKGLAFDEPIPAGEREDVNALEESLRARAIANNRLLHTVGTLGVLQYPLCVVLLLLSFELGRRMILARCWVLAAACCVFFLVGAMGLFMAFHRGYLSSLGL